MTMQRRDRLDSFEPTFLGRVATRIVNEVKGINRTVYNFTSKAPVTLEWD
jgi:GMP synthase (glutamine-hydrolysing)